MGYEAGLETIESLNKASYLTPFRKVEIKRRLADGSGDYESAWYDVTDNIKSFGNITWEIDVNTVGSFIQSNASLIGNNTEKAWEDETFSQSLFSGYLTRYKTLFRISTGLYDDDGNISPKGSALFFPDSDYSAQNRAYVNSADYDLNTDTYTLEAWGYPNDKSWQYILRYGNSAPQTNYSVIFHTVDNIIFLWKDTGGITRTKSSGFKYEKNKWYHVVAVVKPNDDQIIWYVNGVKNTTAVSFSTRPLKSGTTLNLTFGGGPGNGNSNLGVDEARIYNRELTQEEVMKHYNQGKGTATNYSTSGLIGGWHFDEGTGTTVADYSSSGNDLTIQAGTGDGTSWIEGRVDNEDKQTFWYGILTDGIQNTETESNLVINSLTQIFREQNVSGLSLSATDTASDIVTKVLALTDNSSNNVFNRFITGTDITATTVDYPDVATPQDQSCWDVINRMCLTEDYCGFIGSDGKFYFKGKDATADVKWNFNGAGAYDSTYGVNIIGIEKANNIWDKIYNRVVIEYDDSTYSINTDTWSKGDGSSADKYGERQLNISELWLDSSGADTLGTALKTSYKDPKREVILTSSTYNPQLSLLDRVSVNYYGENTVEPAGIWGVSVWGLSYSTGVGLWTGKTGGIYLKDEEMSIIGIELDLDNFVSKFHLREI